MIGKWELTQDEIDYWLNKGELLEKSFKANEISIVDLTDCSIAPNQVHEVLIKLGWDDYKCEDGLEKDYWVYWKKEGCKDIILYVSGLTFEMAIYLKKDKFKESMKDKHRLQMLS